MGLYILPLCTATVSSLNSNSISSLSSYIWNLIHVVLQCIKTLILYASCLYTVLMTIDLLYSLSPNRDPTGSCVILHYHSQLLPHTENTSLCTHMCTHFLRWLLCSGSSIPLALSFNSVFFIQSFLCKITILTSVSLHIFTELLANLSFLYFNDEIFRKQQKISH